MFKKILLGCLIVAFSLFTGIVQLLKNHHEVDPLSKARVVEAYGRLPLSFEANQGQTDSHVKFLSRGSGYTLFLTSTEAVLALRQGTGDRNQTSENSKLKTQDGDLILRMQLVGANPEPKVTGLDELPGKGNYFTGNDPEKWRTNVPSYARVEYREVYPGVNLVYYGNQRQLEYDWVVAPGADPKAITLRFGGLVGALLAAPLQIDAQGDLVLHTEAGEVRQRKPVVYQEVEGGIREIEGSYVLRGENQVGFEVAAYDTEKTLVIDPVLVYSTFLGGSNEDAGAGIAIDSQGNIYVSGHTFSPDFPVENPLEGTLNGSSDAFVAKLNPSGSTLIYATYLGGSGSERNDLTLNYYPFPHKLGIVVDASGNVYMGGGTADSTDFPTTSGAFQEISGGSGDAFVAKLDASGSALVYSTYLGGSGLDWTGQMVVDGEGNAYVAGTTGSTDFPTTHGAFQETSSDKNSLNVFVAKLDATGSSLIYSTYLSGRREDRSMGIAVDGEGNAYVTGRTESSDFPVVNPFQAQMTGIYVDAFVTKLNALGSDLLYSTYLGGSDSDYGLGIAVDGEGNAYVTGLTFSRNFPTVGIPFQPTFGGLRDLFVAKLDPSGSDLVYSTYLGGSRDDWGSDIAVDSAGNAYVTGYTFSLNFPTANPLQATYGGDDAGADDDDDYGGDAIVAKLNASGSDLLFSTYLGGIGQESASNILVDASGNIFVAGYTYSADFPTAAPFQDYGGGTCTHGEDAYPCLDAFLLKISEETVPGDSDGDGIPDSEDNCDDVANVGQQNEDGDEAGAACDRNDNCGAISYLVPGARGGVLGGTIGLAGLMIVLKKKHLA